MKHEISRETSFRTVTRLKKGDFQKDFRLKFQTSYKLSNAILAVLWMSGGGGDEKKLSHFSS